MTSESEVAGAYVDDEDEGMSEDSSVYASEPSRQFRQWHRIFADEVPDTTWAEQLRSDLARRAGGRARTVATFHQIDCRETICRLYLHTNDATDAQAVLTAVSNDGPVEVEPQQLAARVQLEDAPGGGTTYELVVRRDRPTWMPPHVAGAGPAYFQALATREDE
jgi:hypothetical protein